MQKQTGRDLIQAANIVFYIGVGASVLLGIIYMIARRGVGIIAGIIIIPLGIFGAYIYKLLLTGFGHIVENQSVQTDLLQHMIDEMQNKADASMEQPVEAEPAKIVETPGDSPPAPPVQTAEFESRTAATVFCPVCGKEQKTNRNFCYSCGCKFIFRDEPPQ